MPRDGGAGNGRTLYLIDHMNKLILSILISSIFLSSCAVGPPEIVTSVTSFHQLPQGGLAGKRVAIRAHPPERQQSLEFASYRERLATRLAERDATVVDSVADAELVAFVSYGVDDGRERTETYSVPEYGYIGGGTTLHSGTIRTSKGEQRGYSGSSYTMPVYGVTGYSTRIVTSTIYMRHLDIDIVDRASLDAGNPHKLYEARLVSRGTCGSMAPIFDPMLQALFQEWPGPSGGARTVTTPWSGQC